MKRFRNYITIILIAGMLMSTAQPGYAGGAEQRGLRNLLKRANDKLGEKILTTVGERVTTYFAILAFGGTMFYLSFAPTPPQTLRVSGGEINVVISPRDLLDSPATGEKLVKIDSIKLDYSDEQMVLFHADKALIISPPPSDFMLKQEQVLNGRLLLLQGKLGEVLNTDYAVVETTRVDMEGEYHDILYLVKMVNIIGAL